MTLGGSEMVFLLYLPRRSWRRVGLAMGLPFTRMTSGLLGSLGFVGTPAGITSHLVTNEYGFRI